MKKRFAVLIAMILTLSTIFAGCGAQEAKIEPQTVKIATLAGPTGMGMAPMMNDDKEIAEGVKLDFTLATSPDKVVGDVINGTYQIAGLPTNTAAVVYNKTGGKVVLGAVNTLGTLSIVGDKSVEGITSIADLKGNTIGVVGQGAVPEYVLRALLEKNGLNPDTDVTLKWYAEHAEAAAALVSGEVQIAMLPQPYATSALTQNQNLVQLIDLNTAWEEAYGCQMEMGCVVVNKEWADTNPELLKKFMDEYKVSVDEIKTDDDQAAKQVVQAGILQNEDMAKKVIPNCALTFISAQDAKEDLNTFLQTLYNFNPESVGGTLPALDSDFYSLSW